MSNDEKETVSQQVSQGDFHLRDVILLANGTKAEFPITLTVGGMLISGLLTGGKRYFEEFAETMANAHGTAETSEQLREFFSRRTKIYDAPEEGEPPVPLAYVHLREARFFVPGAQPVPSSGGVLWRGRLSQVDGFHLGMLTVG